MFTKVLIAEDIDSTNVAVVQLINEMGITHVDFAKYCDEALLKIRKALLDEQPFDLLLTDLYFKADFRESVLTSGEELIEKVKEVQPDIKVVVYSQEEKSFTIKSLFRSFDIRITSYNVCYTKLLRLG